jgi:tetratricopeptide (TPR) repeat protein
MSVKPEQDINTVIASIQKIFLYLFVAVIPIPILPFPWDLTEKGMTLVLLFFTLVIGSLELIKIIWSGKVLFLKRDIDLVLFLLLISLILTTVFAQDTNLSIYGYDYRLSGGLIGMGSVLLLAFITRSFISSKRDLQNLFNSFLIGSIFTSILSLLSLYGVSIFNLIPKIGLAGKQGFPTLGTPTVLVIYNCISIFLSYISLGIKSDSQKSSALWIWILSLLINGLSLVLFSVDQSAFLITVIFLLLWILVLVFIFLRDKRLNTKSKIKMSIIPLLLLISVSVIQIESLQNIIIPDDSIKTPINLTLDASWSVVSQSLMQSLKNGIVGLGLDSFGVIFAELKPVEWVNINLVSSYNEILTNLSSGGFLWFVIWLLLGWYVLRDLITDIKNFDNKSKILILFDSLVLFIYITSFFTTYTIILRLSFFLIISSGIILRNIYKQQEVDNILLKMWTMGTGKKDTQGVPIISVFFSAVIAILLILGIWRLGSITLSSLYLLRAESYISQENEKFLEQNPTKPEEKEITENLYRWYQNALRYDKRNPLTNRKASLVAVDKLGVLLEQYKEETEEEVLQEAVRLRSDAFEYSRTAINLSPSLYAGYNNRALVYLGIINFGYTEYIRDAISVIDDAIEMKPLDYQNYYNKAQLYYLLQNYELALRASSEALGIKGDYIPALILSANINGAQENTEVQLSYLNAAKTILEQNELQSLQLYKDIQEQIEQIGSEEIQEQPIEDLSESSEDVLEIEQEP